MFITILYIYLFMHKQHPNVAHRLEKSFYTTNLRQNVKNWIKTLKKNSLKKLQKIKRSDYQS